MYKVLNFNSSATSGKIGDATKVRATVKDGVLKLRFTNRSSDANLSNDQLLKDLGTKGAGKRVGLPTAFSELLSVGEGFTLVPGKYGWFTVAQGGEATDGRVSA